MEIKIISRVDFKGGISSETYIFEGKDIIHAFVPYNNRKEFVEKTNDSNYYRMIGVLDTMFKEDEPDESGYFINLSFYENEFLRMLIIKNSFVYITSHGQTIDKVEVN